MSVATSLLDALAGQVRPLTRREYDHLVLDGAFEDEPIELLEGFLVEMSPEGPLHSDVIRRLNELLVPALVGVAQVRVGHPLALGARSEPEPDVAVVAPGDYHEEHPTGAWLVIECSRSSRRKDLGVKAEVYASHGVPEYWVVDLATERVVVHTEPAGARYRRVAEHARGDTLHPSALEDLAIDVDQILP